MTAQQQVQPAPTVTSGAMIRTLGGIAMISGFLVVLVFQLTLPVINENKRKAIEKAVFNVIPNAEVRHDFIITDDGVVPASDDITQGLPIYAGYDKEGRLAGIAAEAAAQGYQDVIRLLFGYNPECECITGIQVLKMAETPGLGDKIITDPAFRANFKALEAKLNSDRNALANPIITVKHGSKTAAWQIDAISGATVTSKAVGKALNNSAQKLLPQLDPHMRTIRQSAAGDRRADDNGESIKP